MFYLHIIRGKDFRVDYGHLSGLCATFSNVPVLAMTATATKSDREFIIGSLGLKHCAEIVGNPDRVNILYEKHFRAGDDMEAITDILTPIAEGLLKDNISYALTVIYIPLKWCGFVYHLFDYILNSSQYYPPGSPNTPENRLFAQFHSPQTKEMKEEVLKQLCSKQSTIRVVFASVALGMGIDIPDIRHVVHITPPYTIQQYCQETGRAGRDGLPSTATLHYNNYDVAKSKPGFQEAMRTFCQSEDQCLRNLLLTSLDAEPKHMVPIHPKHRCCNICQEDCMCSTCTDLSFI